MKKFITGVPLQAPKRFDAYHYQAVGNSKLETEGETRFPIMTAMEGYAQAGEEIRVIALVSDGQDCHENADTLSAELESYCRRSGVLCPKGVERVVVPLDGTVATHMDSFQKLIEFAEDDDELFACTTYGTKPMSTVITMAVQYAYRLKENTSISCIVYGQINRKDGHVMGAEVYDITALAQMDEIVRMLADRGVENPKETINQLLAL